MFVGGNGKGRFLKPQPIKRFPSSPGPPLKDMRYTTCQGRNGAVPGRSCSGPGVTLLPLLLPPGHCGRGRAEGHSAGGKAAAEGRPAQARGPRRGAHPLRRGRWQGLDRAAPPGWAPSALWAHRGFLASRRLGVFIQTREADKAEVVAAVALTVAVAAVALAAAEPFRISSNVSAAPRPPHASASLLARSRRAGDREAGTRLRACVVGAHR